MQLLRAFCKGAWGQMGLFIPTRCKLSHRLTLISPKEGEKAESWQMGEMQYNECGWEVGRSAPLGAARFSTACTSGGETWVLWEKSYNVLCWGTARGLQKLEKITMGLKITLNTHLPKYTPPIQKSLFHTAAKLGLHYLDLGIDLSLLSPALILLGV